MITKWGKIVAQMALVMNNYRRAGAQIKTAAGATKYYFSRYNSNAWPTTGGGGFTAKIGNPGSTTTPGVYFGSGTTTPTEDDYTLEAPITSGLTAASSSFQYNDGFDANGNPQNVIVFTLRNTSSSDITISEIGWFINGDCDTNNPSAGGSYMNNILVDHTLLNTPVTIPAGESAAITYTIKVVLPSS